MHIGYARKQCGVIIMFLKHVCVLDALVNNVV